MAKTSMIVKAERMPKFSTRKRNRCKVCGRPRGFLRKFQLCRICFRNLSLGGYIPGVTKAKKSIASFKLREGQSIGTMVTLRGEKMYEFLDRLINIALPRVRDFRGVAAKSFDGRGNYTLGIRDHLIFPEIDPVKVDKSKGMNITIVTTAKTDEHARVLLRELGLPFSK